MLRVILNPYNYIWISIVQNYYYKVSSNYSYLIYIYIYIYTANNNNEVSTFVLMIIIISQGRLLNANYRVFLLFIYLHNKFYK